MIPEPMTLGTTPTYDRYSASLSKGVAQLIWDQRRDEDAIRLGDRYYRERDASDLMNATEN